MTDLALVAIMIRAHDGDMHPLADWVEQGRSLDSDACKFIADRLRGNPLRGKGPPRTITAMLRDSETLSIVDYLARIEKMMSVIAREDGRKYRAKSGVRAYLELDPGMNENTLSDILKRARRDRRAQRDKRSKVPKSNNSTP